MKSEKEKPYNGGEWTTARYNSFIKGGLRSISQRWPPKYRVLAKAYVGTKTNAATGRMAKHFLCNSCSGHFPQKLVEVNHVVAVIPPSGFDSWDGVIRRMFCEEIDLEVLCKPCHKSITQQENAERKASKE